MGSRFAEQPFVAECQAEVVLFYKFHRLMRHLMRHRRLRFLKEFSESFLSVDPYMPNEPKIRPCVLTMRFAWIEPTNESALRQIRWGG